MAEGFASRPDAWFCSERRVRLPCIPADDLSGERPPPSTGRRRDRVFGRGALLTGNPIATNTFGYDAKASPYRTYIARAKACVAEAGYAIGFEAPLFFDQGFATINPAMDKLIDAARFEPDAKKYADAVRGFGRIAVDDVPRVAIYQPNLDVAMQKNIRGYQYWFHRQLDYRQLAQE